MFKHLTDLVIAITVMHLTPVLFFFFFFFFFSTGSDVFIRSRTTSTYLKISKKDQEHEYPLVV